MRTSVNAFRCANCSSEIEVRIKFPTWVQSATIYVDKIAAAEKWDTEKRVCVMCRNREVP